SLHYGYFLSQDSEAGSAEVMAELARGRGPSDYLPNAFRSSQKSFNARSTSSRICFFSSLMLRLSLGRLIQQNCMACRTDWSTCCGPKKSAIFSAAAAASASLVEQVSMCIIAGSPERSSY